MSAQSVFLPEEILIEIFCYMEAMYLLRCKCVCKSWYAVIRSKQLVEMHLIRNGYRYYDMHTAGKSRRIREKIKYMCHPCRGLVLSSLDAGSSFTYRISNPTTNYTMDLPPHPHKAVRRSMHLFLNTCTDSYNVLSICFDGFKRTRHLELLDLGGQSNDSCPNTDLSWTTLNLVNFETVDTHFHPKYCMPPEGCILYVLHPPYPRSTKLKITCIDIVTLTGTTLDLPVNLCLHPMLYHFQFWRGKPSVVYILEDKLNILALEDYKSQKWADILVFPLPSSNNYLFIEPRISTDDFFYCEHPVPPGRRSDHYFVYKLESKEAAFVPSLPRKVAATLVSVRGMQPQKKEPRIKITCR